MLVAQTMFNSRHIKQAWPILLAAKAAWGKSESFRVKISQLWVLLPTS